MKSYEFMLHFYGCKLKNAQGELIRHESYRSQYDNLNYNFHNYLRITRILKCMGEFGFEQHKVHFLNHFIQEIYEENELSNCAESLEKYWIGTIKDDDVRDEMFGKIQEYQAKEREESGHWSMFNTRKTSEKSKSSSTVTTTPKKSSDNTSTSTETTSETPLVTASIPIVSTRSSGRSPKPVSNSWKLGADEHYLRLVEGALDSDETGSDETTQSSDDADETPTKITSTSTSTEAIPTITTTSTSTTTTTTPTTTTTTTTATAKSPAKDSDTGAGSDDKDG